MNAAPSAKTIVPQLLHPLTRLISAGEVITAQDWEYARKVRDLVDGIVVKVSREATHQEGPVALWDNKDANFLSHSLWEAGISLRQLQMHHVETLGKSPLDVGSVEMDFSDNVIAIEGSLEKISEKDPLFFAAVTHFSTILPELLQPISLSPEAVLERDWGKVMEEAAKAVNPPPSRPRP